MTHYGLNDCTNLSNIIDIMNSLTEWTRQKRWDKQETQEYMLHWNASKLDKLT